MVDDGINAHIPAYGTRNERVNGLSTFVTLTSQNAHPSTETNISRTLFVLHVIYNKQYRRCVVRFKLNRGPSTVRFVFFPNYWLLFPTITVIINKPSPVIENMLISQMRCCRTQLEQKAIGHQTPEVMIWAPMFQVINGALESIIAGSSCEWLILHCVVLFSQLEMKLGDTLIHA